MKRGLLILAAVVFVAGIAMIGSSTAAQREASRADRWDQKRGIVERVEGGNVAYRYEAGGATHRGQAPVRPRFVYTTGRPVLVYVNPAAPAESLLELPSRPSNAPLLAGAVALLVGAAIAIGALLLGKEAPAPARKGTRPPTGDTTTRRKAPPMSRLKPPPPAPRRRAEGDETAGGSREP